MITKVKLKDKNKNEGYYSLFVRKIGVIGTERYGMLLTIMGSKEIGIIPADGSMILYEDMNMAMVYWEITKDIESITYLEQ